MSRRLLVAAAAAAIMASDVPCRAQSANPATLQLPLVYSTTPMTRNADLMLSASILSTSVSEAGLANISPSLFRSAGWKSRAARATKLALFDVPVVYYFGTLNHEWGHQTRSTEYGVDSELSFTGTPWSGRAFFLAALEPMSGHPLAAASIHGGGLEASRVLKDRAESMMLGVERVPPGHALSAIISSLDVPVYSLVNLGSEELSLERLTDNYVRGDPATIVLDLFNRRRAVGSASLDTIRRQVRSRSALNLLDAALWSETAGLLGDYVWRGEPDVLVRWLRLATIRVLPSVRYELSPFGPEYYVRTLYRAFGASGTAYGRWTEHIGADHQAGGGFSLSRWATPRFQPSVSVDAWSHTADGCGVRGEVAADVRGWPGQRAALTIAVGAKSHGYLLGFPMDRGAYLNAGVTLKVW